MDDHGYTQEDHRNVARTKVSPNHYQWTFPDGRTWLDAVKTAEIVRDQGDVQQEAKAQQEQAASRRETVMPTAEERRLNRVETAERALSVYTDQDREANLTDLLADAMHWSKQEGIDFERCLERARAHYRTEVHEAQQELSREAEKHEERGIGR